MFYTYQDLLAVGNDEKKRRKFIIAAKNAHTSSYDYKFAVDAEKYYNGENVTINHYEKIIYDLQGQAHSDTWSANHKIASHFYSFVIDQEISYLLRNGVMLEESAKENLGEDFDETIAELAQYARVHGRSYGLWDNGKIVKYKFTNFAPLYDEETSKLAAGIWFWKISDNKPERITLFEPDGYTKYIMDGGNLEYLEKSGRKGKQTYLKRRTKSEYDGEIVEDYGNYNGFPIIEMRNGEHGRSTLLGKRNTVDALDFLTSQLVNNVSEGTLVYWALVNCNAMSEEDDARFIANLQKSHAVHVDGDNGASAVPHTVEAPVNASSVSIEEIEKRLYKDFMAFDYRTITASNQTATAIQAATAPLDEKCDKIEGMVTLFIKQIMKIAGTESKSPTYSRNKIRNKEEEIQNLILEANMLPQEYIQEKIITLNGDIDRIEEIKSMWAAEQGGRIEND